MANRGETGGRRRVRSVNRTPYRAKDDSSSHYSYSNKHGVSEKGKENGGRRRRRNTFNGNGLPQPLPPKQKSKPSNNTYNRNAAREGGGGGGGGDGGDGVRSRHRHHRKTFGGFDSLSKERERERERGKHQLGKEMSASLVLREKQLVNEAQERIMRNPMPTRSEKPSLMRVPLSYITNHIILGRREDAQDANRLYEIGVTHVLNATTQLPNYHPTRFVYKHIELLDSEDVDIASYFKQASAFLKRVEDLRGRVLVHCIAGVSRSATFVIRHLMAFHNLRLKAAYHHVKKRRFTVNPNDRFKLALAKYEISKFGTTTVARKAGKDWDFYDWNKMKGTVRFEHDTTSVASAHGSGICAIL